MMGNWTIVIEGKGPHHNKDNPGDADIMLLEFIEKLQANGQHVSHASFTQSGRETLEKIGPTRIFVPG